MEFCSGSVSLFHKRRHATTAAFRSTSGTIILNSAHICICMYMHAQIVPPPPRPTLLLLYIWGFWARVFFFGCDLQRAFKACFRYVCRKHGHAEQTARSALACLLLSLAFVKFKRVAAVSLLLALPGGFAEGISHSFSQQLVQQRTQQQLQQLIAARMLTIYNLEVFCRCSCKRTGGLAALVRSADRRRRVLRRCLRSSAAFIGTREEAHLSRIARKAGNITHKVIVHNTNARDGHGVNANT